MDGNLALNAHFENLPEEAMNTSPINGLNYEQFEKIRGQIIEYIKMYHHDGEAIGAYKIMKLFEPFLSDHPTGAGTEEKDETTKINNS